VKNILVIGGSGYIGTNFIYYALNKGSIQKLINLNLLPCYLDIYH